MTIQSNQAPSRCCIRGTRTALTASRRLGTVVIAAAWFLDSGLSLAAASTVSPAKASVTAPPAGAYKLDKAHASITLRASHMGFSTYTTRFSRLDADLTFDPRDLPASKETLIYR